jgi:hypothetical protein
MLGRDTEWRQGSVLTQSDAAMLGIHDADAHDLRVVVISHDCDLANDKEEQAELIVARLVDKVDGLAARARNVRRLHLTYATPQGNSICVELTHTARKLISRELFANAHQPDDGLKLSIDEKRALKQWLAARYGRPAFPDAFENRLRKKVKKHTVEGGVHIWVTRATPDDATMINNGRPFFSVVVRA